MNRMNVASLTSFSFARNKNGFYTNEKGAGVTKGEWRYISIGFSIQRIKCKQNYMEWIDRLLGNVIHAYFNTSALIKLYKCKRHFVPVKQSQDPPLSGGSRVFQNGVKIGE